MEKTVNSALARFRQELVTLRKQNKLTQKDVAKKLGITHQSYQAYETGVAVPTLKNFIKLAIIFDVSTAELLGEN